MNLRPRLPVKGDISLTKIALSPSRFEPTHLHEASTNRSRCLVWFRLGLPSDTDTANNHRIGSAWLRPPSPRSFERLAVLGHRPPLGREKPGPAPKAAS